jgi:hypothetical protein
VCGVKRARPSFSESNTLNTSASSRRIKPQDSTAHAG